jgi:hypothetical protein
LSFALYHIVRRSSASFTESPLRGINHSGQHGNPRMSRPQAALRTSALVITGPFPHHGGTENDKPCPAKCRARRNPLR